MKNPTSHYLKQPARSPGGLLVVRGAKRCGGCEEEKSLDEFYASKSAPDGRQARCKACQREYSSKWNRENRDRHLANKRRSWNRHKDRLNAKRRAERDEAVLARERKWREQNADKLRRQVREYRAKHPEKVKEWNARWQAKDGGEWRRRRYAEDPAPFLARNHIRRMGEGVYGPEMAEAIRVLRSQSCVYCGSPEDIEIDHIVPLSRGGTNDLDNLAPACRPCNRSKFNRLPDEWQGRDAA